MAQSHEPIRLDANHAKSAFGLMARAFQDDPAWKYLVEALTRVTVHFRVKPIASLQRVKR